MIIVPLMYACGLSITKLGSAAQRTTIDCARNITVWIFFMTVPVFGKIMEYFMWLQLLGFVILLLGVLVYNEILIIPLWRFNYYTGQAIAERKDEQEREQHLSERLILHGFAEGTSEEIDIEEQ